MRHPSTQPVEGLRGGDGAAEVRKRQHGPVEQHATHVRRVDHQQWDIRVGAESCDRCIHVSGCHTDDLAVRGRTLAWSPRAPEWTATPTTRPAWSPAAVSAAQRTRRRAN